ncbi:LysR family transcriptional regulator [Streptacidiphilus sp. ASG 303]|uniref:LysR family transcriptional regulator n=1 Tax=Streptacidiphilus sp. ASG 303 TaxID=2896847 RepID=UPI001E285F4F|nr:LysR family transcriptional regulator [Streptacidiphilus sp. ASG 303]MCD0482266.1 LysR family transcriptional regulator [Streptacidiphilus sp. ASG 303]
MDLALLRTFLTVHRAGSITRAAQLLGLSQPAVTGQIRSLERQLGRPLFLRQPRGVAPTGVADELAHRVAPHLDALGEITGQGADGPAARTLHLAGPAEFCATHVLPALAGLVADGLAVRLAAADGDEALAGLAAATHDLAVTTSLPRGRLFHAVPLYDEEHVLVGAERWARAAAVQGPAVQGAAGQGAAGQRATAQGWAGQGAAGQGATAQGWAGRGPAWRGPAWQGTAALAAVAELERLPLLDCGEELPFVTPYWSTVFDTGPGVPAALVAPDLRAVLNAAREGAGIAVLPRHLCGPDLAAGTLRVLLEPPMAPLRTFFLVVRAGTLDRPAVARAHSRLLAASARW